MAARYHWAVGDLLTLDQRGWDTSQPFTVEITGIAAPNDVNDPYWMSPSPFRIDGTNNLEATILLDRDQLLHVASTYLPQARSTFGWRFLFNHDALAFGQISQAVDQLHAFEASMERIVKTDQQLSLIYTTGLPAVLTNYQQEVNLLNAPFGTLMLQIGGLTLFFLLIVAALAQRSERREIAILKQRGALDWQIILLHALEAAMISAGAVIIAPFIARQALLAFAPLLAKSGHLTLELTAQPFIYAGGAGILAVVVLLITLRPVLKLPLSSAGGSVGRAARQSWWQRMYLDLLLLVVGSAALFRLLATDSPFAQSLFGGVRADPLLLIAPALLFVALGSVTLRLFPLMTDALARLFAARRGVEGALAAWAVSRDPAHYSRIAFLLALAIGVGWFATSFQATLTQSYADQAGYRVGADVRLTQGGTPTHPTNIPVDPAAYRQLADVRDATAALRLDSLNFSLDGLQTLPGSLLGVDSASFAATAYWRSDLGQLPLPPASDLPTVGVPLPDDTAKIGAWIRLDNLQIDPQTGAHNRDLPLIAGLYDTMTIFARVRAANGTFQQVELIPQRIEGTTADASTFAFDTNRYASAEVVQADRDRLQAALEGISGWVYFEGEIEAPSGSAAQQIDMLYWRAQLGNWRYAGEWRRLTIAAVTPLDAQGHALPGTSAVREDWTFVPDNPTVVTSDAQAISTDKGMGWQIDWTQRQSRTAFSIDLYPDAPPISAVISTGFAQANALDPGAAFTLHVDNRPLSFVVAGTADYFPMLYADAPFAVVDLNALLYQLNRRPGSAAYPNETLIALDAGTDAQAWTIDHVPPGADITATTTAAVRASLRDDVLALGLSHLLLISFIIALVLSVVSLLIFVALSVKSRRDQFAVLRALGLSSGRIALSVTLEQVVLFIVALVLGGVMGVLLSGQVLPSLAISGSGGVITPPFLVRLEVAALLQYFATLAGLLALVLIASMILIRRLSVGQALRYGDE